MTFLLQEKTVRWNIEKNPSSIFTCNLLSVRVKKI